VGSLGSSRGDAECAAARAMGDAPRVIGERTARQKPSFGPLLLRLVSVGHARTVMTTTVTTFRIFCFRRASGIRASKIIGLGVCTRSTCPASPTLQVIHGISMHSVSPHSTRALLMKHTFTPRLTCPRLERSTFAKEMITTAIATGQRRPMPRERQNWILLDSMMVGTSKVLGLMEGSGTRERGADLPGFFGPLILDPGRG